MDAAPGRSRCARLSAGSSEGKSHAWVPEGLALLLGTQAQRENRSRPGSTAECLQQVVMLAPKQVTCKSCGGTFQTELTTFDE